RSNDGLTLLMTSSDGFCSTLSFTPGELGQVYNESIHRAHHPTLAKTATSSAQSTPIPTPTSSTAPPFPTRHSTSVAPSPPPISNARPSSPTRSNSTSSVATQASFYAQPPPGTVINNPTPTMSSLPSAAATNS